MIKALRYLSDGPGIDSRWCHWGFFCVVPSDKTICPEFDSASENEYKKKTTEKCVPQAVL